MALVVKFELTDGTAEFYDAVCDRLNFPQEIPEGLISHCGFPTSTGFCVCEFWDTPESQEAFWNAKLEQAIGETSQEFGISPEAVDMQLQTAHMAYARELSPIHV